MSSETQHNTGMRNYNHPDAGDATPRIVNGNSTTTTTANSTTASASNHPEDNATQRMPPVPNQDHNLPRSSSTSSATAAVTTTKPTSVAPSRKQELLQQARSARLEWLRQVPFPYSQDDTHSPSSSSLQNDNDNNNLTLSRTSPLAPLADTHAGRHMPAALHILQHLYGLDTNTNNAALPNDSERVREYVTTLQQAHSLTVPTPEQVRQMTLQEHEEQQQQQQNTTAAASSSSFLLDDEEARLLSIYHRFLQQLTHPAAATLVQGMKRFVQHVLVSSSREPLSKEQSKSKQQQSSNTSSSDNDTTTIKPLANLLQSYTTSTLETIRQHALWKDEFGDTTNTTSTTSQETLVWTRRALESLIYGHVRLSVERAVLTSQQSETAWQERLALLQFVQPQHLEVACLVPYNSTTTTENDDPATSLSTLLQAPIRALSSVARYHAPYEKLQRILAMYRGINAALTKALNPETTTPDSTKTPKLPSADDVLPTIILTVLATRPSLRQLSIVEELCPPEYLRGEAGYAFTNLYGAVQFLLELPLVEDTNATNNNLTIAPEEFLAGLERCRAQTQSQLDKQQQEKKASSTVMDESSIPTYESLLAVPQTPITPNDIRLARERGDVIDEAWAVQFQQARAKDQNGLAAALTLLDNDDDEGEQAVKDDSPAEESKSPTRTASSGFRRSYSFLSHMAKDITVHDLPQLLEEYRQMAHATEALLAERQAQIAKEKKAQLNKDQKDLYDRAKVVDPSLLATDKKAAK